MKKALSFLLAVILCGGILRFVGADPGEGGGHTEEVLTEVTQTEGTLTEKTETEETLTEETQTEEIESEEIHTEEGSESVS